MQPPANESVIEHSYLFPDSRLGVAVLPGRLLWHSVILQRRTRRDFSQLRSKAFSNPVSVVHVLMAAMKIKGTYLSSYPRNTSSTPRRALGLPKRTIVNDLATVD